MTLFFLASPLVVWAGFSDCSDGWEVTGYYVPSESDFSGAERSITLAEGGERTLKQDFLDTVLIEGSGFSEAGEIIEWYWDNWHVNDRPEDYFGDELVIGTAATDPEVIPLKDKFTIPSLQAPYNEIIYTANDIGPSIKGKHIDVFMGFGSHALDEAWKFPDYNTLCLESVDIDTQSSSDDQASVKLTKSPIDDVFSKALSGRILLEAEKNGEAWYVYPEDSKRYYLGRPADAFDIMKSLGLGARHEFIGRYVYYPNYVLGRILIDVDDSGKAYYINPTDKKAYYLSRPADAFRIMGGLGLGINEENINKIEIGEL